MFIKFSDKTKNIMVKKSKKQAYRDGYVEENSIYLDSDDEKDNQKGGGDLETLRRILNGGGNNVVGVENLLFGE